MSVYIVAFLSFFFGFFTAALMCAAKWGDQVGDE